MRTDQPHCVKSAWLFLRKLVYNNRLARTPNATEKVTRPMSVFTQLTDSSDPETV